MTPEELRAAVDAGDVAALGRAQTRGEDIRPPHQRPAPVPPPTACSWPGCDRSASTSNGVAEFCAEHEPPF